MQKIVYWLTAGVLSMLTLALVASGASAAKVRSAPLRLLAGTFTPTKGETLQLDPALTASNTEASGRGYFLLQFKGPVRAAWKQALEAQGVEFLAYVPDFAFKVRMNGGNAESVRGLQNVAWLGAFHPAYKLGANLNRGAESAYTIRLEQGADAQAILDAIHATGARAFESDEDIVRVAASSDQVNAIARIADVAYIENYALNIKHNDYGAGAIIGAGVANGNGFDGSTQTAAVADTGLGDGTAAGAHPNIPATRITAINNWKGKKGICFTSITDDGAQDVDSGHGTHVSGSVLSDGGASGEGKGSAPAAHLVFQAIENWASLSPICGGPLDGYFLTGIPEQLKKLFQQAYDAGARVHSNSWGAAVDGEYTTDAAQVDDFIWRRPDMTITYSAGNAGTDANKDGIVDLDSLGSPATAKNTITVGASENDREGHYECDPSLTYTSHDLYQPGQTCATMGGQNLLGTWGQRYPDSFKRNPLKDDVTAGNAEQMASWSSRGPADDGRLKPDIVAPGTWILSGHQSLYQEGYGDPINPKLGEHAWDGWGMPRNEFYKYMGGTSMSNPIAAGGAVVVRDFYNKEHSHNASAALVKATLINSAHDQLDENNDGANDNDYAIPNNHEGWGRVDLVGATDPSRQYVDNTTGIETGDKSEYTHSVAGGAPFKVTVVWSDYPANTISALNLVNNLDLTVISPSGTKYKGNKFSGGWSAMGGKYDKKNNVECVFIQTAEAGTWTIQVKGKNVPNGPQPFGLVVAGAE